MAAMTEPSRPIYRVPLLGWMLRDLDAGRKDAPFWFMMVIVMLGGIAGLVWGVWAFLGLFLLLTPILLIGYCVAAFSAISGDLMTSHVARQDLQARIARNRAGGETPEG